MTFHSLTCQDPCPGWGCQCCHDCPDTPPQTVDLDPGDYWLTSSGDGRGPALVTLEGRLLILGFDAIWTDLTDVYVRGGRDSWVIEPRTQPHALAPTETPCCATQDEAREQARRPKDQVDS